MIIKGVNRFVCLFVFLSFSQFGFSNVHENPLHQKIKKVIIHFSERHSYNKKKIDVIYTNDGLSDSYFYIYLDGKWLCISYNNDVIVEEMIDSKSKKRELNYIKKNNYKKIHSDCVLNNCNGCTLVNTYRLKLSSKIKIVRSRYLAENSCL